GKLPIGEVAEVTAEGCSSIAKAARGSSRGYCRNIGCQAPIRIWRWASRGKAPKLHCICSAHAGIGDFHGERSGTSVSDEVEFAAVGQGSQLRRRPPECHIQRGLGGSLTESWNRAQRPPKYDDHRHRLCNVQPASRCHARLLLVHPKPEGLLEETP